VKELQVLVNDELVSADRASLLVADLSIQRGYGIFDFFKTLDNRPVFLEEHLERLFQSARRMRLDMGKTRSALKDAIWFLMRKNDLPDSGIRITLTGGYAPDAYSIAHPNLVVTQTPLAAIPSSELPSPIRLVSYPHIRQLPDIKTIDYLMAIWLQPFVREQGADDVLYHHDGVITECPRSNVFMVTPENTLVTPARNILHGVIRGKVLELARRRFEVEERDMSLNQLRTAKEVFITSTGKHIWPVVQVDGGMIGNGSPGPVAEVLNQDLFRLVKKG
jgi:branched-chain amino acid aminotransferase